MSKSELDVIDKLSQDASITLLQALSEQPPTAVLSCAATSAVNIEFNNILRRKLVLGR